MDPLKFGECVDTYRSRFLTSHSRAQLDAVGGEFRRLVSTIELDPSLKAALKEVRKGTFEESWRPLGESFPLLNTFCSGLATVMPTTSLVESDFSRINYARDSTASRLLTIPLEGIIHCKQQDQVRAALSRLDL
ncbi:hypothetical protein KIPB_010795, partial [Kipferlia bialata]|eukprot:g10795.t1